MEKDRGFRVVTVIALIVAIVGLTIGYSAYTTTLKINGSAHVNPAEWKVLFKYTDGQSAVTATRVGKVLAEDVTVPTLTATAISGFYVTLRAPGDSVTFDFQVANDGELDAKLTTYTMGSLTCKPANGSTATQAEATAICNDLSYTLTLANATPAVNDELLKETSKAAKLKLEWNTNSTATAAGDIDVTVGETTLIYTQK